MNLHDITQVKIEVYLPVENLEEMRKALTESKAGIVGNYDNVFATTQVTGHWRPLTGANPYLGKTGVLETAPEIKLEINCDIEHVAKSLQAIRAAHPYEEPLIRVIPILNQFFE
ncbi:MAG TPA: hypothetical protein VK856_05170 [Anaerolineaceae bacterium]|nr:hypothetical protein [Anaerolineaceae bacterium]